MLGTILLAIIAPLGQSSALSDNARTSPTVRYRAVLKSPGGELPFFLEIQDLRDKPKAWIINGPERIEIPKIFWDGDALVLDIAHYDSTIRATPVRKAGAKTNDAPELRGTWRKRRGKDKWSQMDFSAGTSGQRRFTRLAAPEASSGKHPPITGRWRAVFQCGDKPAIGIFEQSADGAVNGTFLTSTGDYRYLAGSYEYGRLRLSCFDGAHAFLFDASIQPDGSLAGDFWSRDSWHETWTARRDDHATLADGFTLTKWQGRTPLNKLRFPDLSGTPRSLDDPAFIGKARVIEVFGSWCPNCHDASSYLAELDRRYRSRGLSIVGLAFEVTGDFERDARQVRKFARRHKIEYPLLIAGLSDKMAATRSLPILDRVRAFPTTIFLHRDGRIRAIHTGFTGPATGGAYRKLQHEFESIIEELLEEER